MPFDVFFRYGDFPNEQDLLDSFDTRSEAEAYRRRQIELEGWEEDDPCSSQYIIVEE